jgi:predicted oxidoreductase
MSETTHDADVVIAGAGLAGLVTAHELLDRGKTVVLLDKDTRERLGGLARESFGGVHLIGTPHQRRMGIKDSPDLAWADWESYAQFAPGDEDEWPRRWARFYCDNSLELVYHFLDSRKIEFLPIVNWPERGVTAPGNRVPRWHIAWGTGWEIIDKVVKALDAHPRRKSLAIFYEHAVDEVDVEGGRARGFSGRNLADGSTFRARGEHVVVASGGICGGDLSTVRANWRRADLGEPPKVLLNGAHRYGDGLLHGKVAALGGSVTHLDRHWHYAAGIHHPAKRRPFDGLSLVPPRSALWMNARGERIGPMPLVGYTDTRFLVESILKQPGQYSWQILNRRIALKELAVSGSDYMTAFRNKSRLGLLRDLLFGNSELVDRLARECPDDFVTADSLGELVDKMNQRSLDGHTVDARALEAGIRDYDDQIDRGESYFNDEQLRRLMNFRTNRGDRIRICKYQKILDSKARPLIAIREFILARKSLGGIKTDLGCRVLTAAGAPIAGLYAVGEAAGFGGGGIHGMGSLEGTFLGSCVLTGRVAGKTIAGA